MRNFTEQDFTWADSDLIVSEASYLGFPVGVPLKEFSVEGRGWFSLVQKTPGYFTYINDGGITAQVFND